MWAFCSFDRTYNFGTAFQNSPLWPLCRAGELRAPGSWLPSVAPPLGELCAPGGRAKSILCSLLTQAFPTRRGMGAVGPAWRHPPDGQTAPLRALFLGTCVCLHLSHPSSSGRGRWDHRSPTEAQHTAVWTVHNGHHRPRPGDHTSSWATERTLCLASS